MSTFWSKEIQSSEILYYSRFARFNDYNKDEWFRLLQITNGIKVLEIGCGPGHFTNMIKRYYPDCDVYGVDLDSNHIEFAKNMADKLSLEINYSVADATKLPFNDNEFDLIISHTVVEHLPFADFISEQKRLLKDGGKVVFICVDPKRKHVNDFDYNENEISQVYNSLNFESSKHTVGQYSQTPKEYLKLLNDYNFKKPKVNFAEIMFYFPYLCETSEEGVAQIKNQEISEIVNAKFSLSLASNGKDYETQLLSLIHDKFNKRMELYLKGENVYDYESTAINVFSAVK